MKFNLSDKVKWSINGKEKEGVIVEIVPAGSSPKNKIYRKVVTAKRDFDSYVVKSGSDLIWPREALSLVSDVNYNQTLVKSEKRPASDDYVKHLENVVIGLAKSHVFNQELFDRPEGRGALFSHVPNEHELQALYEMNPTGDIGQSIQYIRSVMQK